jgi:UDP-glucose 4-epimerase
VSSTAPAATTDQRAALLGAPVLVTGGAGFVGSRLVRHLLDAQARVTVLDDLSTGRAENLPPREAGLRFVEGSVADPKLAGQLVREAGLVFHAAARNIILSTQNPREDYEVNIGGTLNLLLAAREHGTRRFVYTSSASVYGNPRYLPIAEDDLGIGVLSPYSVSKLAGEYYCRAFYETYGLSTSAVRYSNVYGPGQRADNPYCGVVAKFFESARAGEALRIHGDGEQTRDFTYVDDAVDATLRAGLSAKAEGQVYNVGTGRETTVNQLAARILDVTRSRAEVAHVDRRDIDNIRRRVLNIEKIRRELRWVPATTLEQGLQLTQAWLETR